MRKVAFFILCLFVLSLPIAAFALTAEEIQLQIAQLLAQIEALQQQIAQTSTTVANNSNFTASIACFRANRNLFRNLRGSGVEELQRFLLNTGDFTFGEITGYFGSATELAVQRFQCRELGICSGSPKSNGYGFVGVRTRAAMSARCSAPDSTQIQSTPIAVYQCPNIAQPTCRNGTLSSLGNDINGCHRGWLCEVRIVLQNNAPRLELSGPGSLWLNEAGTWTVKATDPDGDNVSVNMYFGNETTNELLQELAYPTSSKSFTRTRAFSAVGSYSIRVSALDTFNNSAQITSVVQVRGKSCSAGSTTLEHGVSKTFYSQTIGAAGSTCFTVSQTRTCDNGTLSGGSSYQYISCTPPDTSGSGGTTGSSSSCVQMTDAQTTSGHNYCGDLICPNNAPAYRYWCSGGSIATPPHWSSTPCGGMFCMTRSDIHLKEDISPIQNALAKLVQLSGVFFKWRDNSMPQERQMGVIAQEVQNVFPEAVIESNGVLYVNYYSLIAPIIEALKELKAENDALRAEVEKSNY